MDHMKAPYLLVAGLIPGVLIGWILASGGRDRASGDPLPQATKIERSSSETKPSFPESSDEARRMKLPRPERTGESRAGRKATITGLDKITPDVRELLEEARKQEAENAGRRVDERLGMLKEALGLSPDQEEKLRALLTDAMSGQDKFFEAMLNGDEYEAAEIAKQGVTAGDGGLDEKVSELLTDEQKQAYEELRGMERENEIEVATYNDMQNLQSAVPSLTPEQKDQAFQALAEIVRREREAPAAMPSGPEGMAERMQSRRDALASILTPEQMKTYESAPMTLRGADQEVVTRQIILSSPSPDKE